jgi:hypothetical protein
VERHPTLVANHVFSDFVVLQMRLESILVGELLETLLTLEHFLSFFQRLMGETVQQHAFHGGHLFVTDVTSAGRHTLFVGPFVAAKENRHFIKNL